MTQEQIKKAEKFLTNCGMLEIFKSNISGSKKDKYENYLKNANVESFINAAFLWQKTKQGFDFWGDLDGRWLNELKTK